MPGDSDRLGGQECPHSPIRTDTNVCPTGQECPHSPIRTDTNVCPTMSVPPCLPNPEIDMHYGRRISSTFVFFVGMSTARMRWLLVSAMKRVLLAAESPPGS